MKKNEYEAPWLEVVELITEGCIAASGEAGTEDVTIVDGFVFDDVVLF